MHRTVTAALAYQRIDEHPLVGVHHLLFLAAAALLGSTGLVVDDCRDAGDLAQFTLHRVHQGPFLDPGAGWHADGQHARWILGDDDDGADPLAL